MERKKVAKGSSILHSPLATERFCICICILVLLGRYFLQIWWPTQQIKMQMQKSWVGWSTGGLATGSLLRTPAAAPRSFTTLQCNILLPCTSGLRFARAHSGALRCTLAHSCALWSTLVSLWCIMVHSGPLWCTLVHYGEHSLLLIKDLCSAIRNQALECIQIYCTASASTVQLIVHCSICLDLYLHLYFNLHLSLHLHLHSHFYFFVFWWSWECTRIYCTASTCSAQLMVQLDNTHFSFCTCYCTYLQISSSCDLT